jgi:hypothetical protein
MKLTNYPNFNMDSVDNSQLAIRVQELLDSIELVFDADWEFTTWSIPCEDLIDLNPFPSKHFTGGKGDNWANRSSFLAAYRELKAFAISEGLYDAEAQ